MKTIDDFYDDVYFRRTGRTENILCGMKIAGLRAQGEATFLRCRQFATGNFWVKSTTGAIRE